MNEGISKTKASVEIFEKNAFSIVEISKASAGILKMKASAGILEMKASPGMLEKKTLSLAEISKMKVSAEMLEKKRIPWILEMNEWQGEISAPFGLVCFRKDQGNPNWA